MTLFVHKNIMYFIIGAFIFITLQSCGLWDDSSDELKANKMILLQSSGKSIHLGDSLTVSFTYDFELGQHEVTQQEFEDVMGFNPIPANQSNLNTHNNPVVFVTYFDMVYYCNQLSKLQGLDTVYSYTNIANDTLGHVRSMESLTVVYSKNGYRLPTESEWEFVARQSQGNFTWGYDSKLASQFAWFSLNSMSTVHDVCTKNSTSGFCDLAGNVLEMVEDFQTSLPNVDSVRNYIGPNPPPADLQRVVKGGSYSSSLDGLATSKRKDVYAVYSESNSAYLGFRIARGAIPNPQSTNENGISESKGSPPVLIASRQAIKDFFGSTEVRLVFVNGSSGNLVSVDYLETNPRVIEWSGIQARHPMISPNGTKITWGTTYEGQTKAGQISLVPFAEPNQKYATIAGSIPRFWIHPKSQDTSIIYTSSASPNSDSLAWMQEETWKASLCGDTLCNHSTLLTKGAFHDGLSADSLWAITAYQNLRVLETSTKSVKTLFQYPANGKDPSATSQACNASIGGANQRILFLDFGYTGKSKLVGRAYGIHEYLFELDPQTGLITDTFLVPSPWVGWNHAEWSTHSNFIIASVTDAQEMNRAIYAIRKSDHKVLKILEGEDLITPHLWVYDGKSPSIALPDSLFNYQIPPHDLNSRLSYRLLQIHDWKDSISIIGLGSSRFHYGLDVNQWFPSEFAYNLNAWGLEQWTMVALIDQYITQLPRLKTAIVELSIDFLQRQHLEFSYWSIEGTYGYQYDKNHNPLQTGITSEQRKVLIKRLQVHPLKFENTPFGYAPSESANWGSISSPAYYPIGATDPNIWKATWHALLNSIQKLHNKGVRILLVTPPQSPAFRALDIYGKYGYTLQEAQEILDTIFTQTKNLRGLAILDEHKMGLHDYSDEMAQNEDHLSALGADLFTQRIRAVLDTLSYPSP